MERAESRAMHELYMKTALALARRGVGRTSPNPMVGCVIVKGGRIVGKGYHHAVGRPHAEIEALSQAGVEGRGSTLYVSLEPCCHQGRTPPCTDAIMRAEVGEVVAAMEDPNPLVAGKGLKILEEAEIKVTCGVLEQKARELNEAYVKHVNTGRPLVILKAGMSLDGKIAAPSGESRWITGEISRRAVHRLRAACDAVMVGAETVIKDDPRLTVRLNGRKRRDPVRIVVDGRLRISLKARIFDTRSGSRVVVATTGSADSGKLRQLKALEGVKVLALGDARGRVNLKRLMKSLGEMGITSLLLEGGGEVNASMLETGLVDKVMLFIAPMIIGGSGSPGVVGGRGTASLAKALRLDRIRYRKMGPDLLVEGYLAGK